MIPKYSLNEIERRWLIEPAQAEDQLPLSAIEITDKYLDGTRLRLRRMCAEDTEPVFKFCKKYGNKQGPLEPITNLYLDADEYALLDTLPGLVVSKMRHPMAPGAIDVYEFDEGALYVFEIEFPSVEDAASYQPPEYVAAEITDIPEYSGYALARRSRS